MPWRSAFRHRDEVSVSFCAATNGENSSCRFAKKKSRRIPVSE